MKASGKAAAASDQSGAERRRSRRRTILSTFSLFVVIPTKGIHRLNIRDVSDQGIGFELDTEAASAVDFPLQIGEEFELNLYLNQSLYLPLAVKVVRLDNPDGTSRGVGAEFVDAEAPGLKAYLSFLQMLDLIIDSARLA
ncbi:MAG: PilZ domain-containing protein [Oligoflexia bacterium]|nr:PilZ domain-containing protein [Oligoflexia bacterium]